jgi:Zn-dependent M28 family amino/carboxypeptidase
VARAISIYAPQAPICFVAFNKEEDGLVGSSEFVENYLPGRDMKISCAHILEMLGYCNQAPGSQQLPPHLPIKVPDRGNFLALLSNRDSHRQVEQVLKRAKSYLPEFPVLALKVYFGLERFIPDLSRSDHYPFWLARIPALLWTDTGEFRNPNYHLKSDRPETLDYNFLRLATQLLLATALQF